MFLVCLALTFAFISVHTGRTNGGFEKFRSAHGRRTHPSRAMRSRPVGSSSMAAWQNLVRLRGGGRAGRPRRTGVGPAPQHAFLHSGQVVRGCRTITAASSWKPSRPVCSIREPNLASKAERAGETVLQVYEGAVRRTQDRGLPMRNGSRWSGGAHNRCVGEGALLPGTFRSLSARP